MPKKSETTSANFIQLDMGFQQPYDSKEELMFSYYVSELLEGGWLHSAEYHPKSFDISEPRKAFAYVRNGHRNDLVWIELAKKHSYTADWKLVWNPKSAGIFYWETGGVYNKCFYPFNNNFADNFVPFYAQHKSEGLVSVIDVKGEFGGSNNTSAITFPINQKVITDIFVQKVIVSLTIKSIFARTFTPRQVIIDEVYKKDYGTHKAGDTKLKYEPRLIEQWTKLHRSSI